MSLYVSLPLFHQCVNNSERSFSQSLFLCDFLFSEPSVQIIRSWPWSIPVSERGGRTALASGKCPRHVHWVTVHYTFRSWGSVLPRTVFCSRTLWQNKRLLMRFGRIESCCGCGAVSVTTKLPCRVISRTPHSTSPFFGNFISTWDRKIIISWRSSLRDWMMISTVDAVCKCRHLSTNSSYPLRSQDETFILTFCTELDSTSLARWQQNRIWTLTFSLSLPELKK